MATTRLSSAFEAVRAKLAADFPSAAVAVFPYDVDPEVLWASSADWPTDSQVAIAIIDRGIAAEERPRGQDTRLQREVAEIEVLMKASSFTTLTALFLSTRRQVFESMQAVERDNSWSHNQWTVEWQAGGAKASKVNTGFQVVLRVDLLVEFSE